ncbi:MAG: hypothetical protein JKY52_08440 [Flavobacteriales bacterium]|nr:hypothetical protein [Flavobacteriales bacterium]
MSNIPSVSLTADISILDCPAVCGEVEYWVEACRPKATLIRTGGIVRLVLPRENDCNQRDCILVPQGEVMRLIDKGWIDHGTHILPKNKGENHE